MLCICSQGRKVPLQPGGRPPSVCGCIAAAAESRVSPPGERKLRAERNVNVAALHQALVRPRERPGESAGGDRDAASGGMDSQALVMAEL